MSSADNPKIAQLDLLSFWFDFEPTEFIVTCLYLKERTPL
jgi:hypothetical protein